MLILFFASYVWISNYYYFYFPTQSQTGVFGARCSLFLSPVIAPSTRGIRIRVNTLRVNTRVCMHKRFCLVWKLGGRKANSNNICFPPSYTTMKEHNTRLGVASGTSAIVKMCLRVLLRIEYSPSSFFFSLSHSVTPIENDAVFHIFFVCFPFIIISFHFHFLLRSTFSSLLSLSSSLFLSLLLFVAVAFGKSQRAARNG